MVSRLFRYCIFILCVTQIGLASADSHCSDCRRSSHCKKNKLNLISYSTSADAWVVADAALVTIGIDANLDQAGLGSMQQKVLAQLKTLSKNVSWRITQNRRQQDQSGLERVRIEAEARIPESDLSRLRAKTKSMSEPGFKFAVRNIEYRPTNAEMEAVASQVRDQLYKNIQAEIQRLSKIYPAQTYFINRLVFVEGDAPVPAARMSEMMMSTEPPNVLAKVASPRRGRDLGMSKKITLTAMVVLGAKINPKGQCAASRKA